jgi:hypothetical protein
MSAVHLSQPALIMMPVAARRRVRVPGTPAPRQPPLRRGPGRAGPPASINYPIRSGGQRCRAAGRGQTVPAGARELLGTRTAALTCVASVATNVIISAGVHAAANYEFCDGEVRLPNYPLLYFICANKPRSCSEQVKFCPGYFSQ